MNILIKLFLVVVCCTSINCFAQHSMEMMQHDTMSNAMHCSDKCNCYSRMTPIGINTEHIHNKGEWMISYSFMDMGMQGTRMGRQMATDNQVYQNYMMSPADMTMQMHMLMVMYGVTDRLTVMAMGSYINNSMTMNIDNMQSMPGMNMSGLPSSMQSSLGGLGDTKLYGLYSLLQKNEVHLTGSLGISIPTGSITETGTTVMGENQRLAYNMQPGTGSYSLLPGIAFTNSMGLFAYGVEVDADLKLNNNSVGYKWGNSYRENLWVAYRFLNFMSGSLRAEGVSAGKISGSDVAVTFPLNTAMDPTADPKNTGGNWVNLYAGLNFHLPQPVLNKFHLLVEYGIPVYQNLNGTQFSLHSNLLTGLQYNF